MKSRRLRFLLLLMIVVPMYTGAGIIQRGDYLQREDVRAFIDNMHQQHGVSVQRLESIIAQARQQARVLELIAKPAEGKPWRDYRPIFVNEKRIAAGVAFWNDNEKQLENAEIRFGVPPEIITAIIGVETFYGTRMGGFPVLDSLATLGFDYPPRAKFFSKELEQFILFSLEEKMDPFSLKGSYAGAMGMGQFMPSSYRQYAVDFDRDGQRDLFSNSADAIGSVANYFARHQWHQGGKIATRARVKGSKYRKLKANDRKPRYTLKQLAAAGVTPVSSLSGNEKLSFLALDGNKGKEFWLGHHNFFVITQYNHSVKYALAVYELSEAIKARRNNAD